MPHILLAAINAKWIHPSLALRLLKANLGGLESGCEIIEFALRQPLCEKIEPILAACPRILGFSVSIWNHAATLELLGELEKRWKAAAAPRPVIVLGGPEVSHLPPEAAIFRYANYAVRGEGEIAFRKLCERITETGRREPAGQCIDIYAEPVNLAEIKSAYHLYTGEELRKKLIYVEASRGCPFNCAFCLSAVKSAPHSAAPAVREFPLEKFIAEMTDLIRRGTRTFKFLDRTFNLDINRARRVMELFLDEIERSEPAEIPSSAPPFTIHFEMVPSRFPPELRKTLARFPPGTLRLEIGIQSLNSEVSARVDRPADPRRELETLRFLSEKTSAIIHADLIAGLPGEDLASFGRGFDRLCAALYAVPGPARAAHPPAEIQLGILKLLPGAPIVRHTQAFGMRYSPAPPYEIMESADLSAAALDRIKNFARFWELIVNRGLLDFPPPGETGAEGMSLFQRFMALSDALLARFGRNWGIDKNELRETARAEWDLLCANRDAPRAQSREPGQTETFQKYL
jgi:hypothetical protein